jgi:hypothetical protein
MIVEDYERQWVVLRAGLGGQHKTHVRVLRQALQCTPIPPPSRYIVSAGGRGTVTIASSWGQRCRHKCLHNTQSNPEVLVD